MRIFSALLLTPFLSGCFFFYIPGSMISAAGDALTGSFGNACVGNEVVVGKRISIDGRVGIVERVSGPSGRCPDARPIRVQVTYD